MKLLEKCVIGAVAVGAAVAVGKYCLGRWMKRNGGENEYPGRSQPDANAKNDETDQDKTDAGAKEVRNIENCSEVKPNSLINEMDFGQNEDTIESQDHPTTRPNESINTKDEDNIGQSSSRAIDSEDYVGFKTISLINEKDYDIDKTKYYGEDATDLEKCKNHIESEQEEIGSMEQAVNVNVADFAEEEERRRIWIEMTDDRFEIRGLDAERRSTSSASSGGIKEFRDKYRILQTLNETSSFGTLKIYKNMETGSKVIAKFVEAKKSLWVDNVPLEIQVMEEGRCNPYIAKLIEWYFDDGIIVMVMPYSGGIDLCDYIQTRGTCSEEWLRENGAKILSAIAFLHNIGYVHQDVKLDNVIIDEATSEVYLIDFGSSFPYNRDVKDFVCDMGSPEYFAPEYKSRRVIRGPECDIYSFGVLLFVLFYGVFPGADLELLSDAFDQHPASTEFLMLLKACRHSDPDERPSAESLMLSNWFQEKTV